MSNRKVLIFSGSLSLYLLVWRYNLKLSTYTFHSKFHVINHNKLVPEHVRQKHDLKIRYRFSYMKYKRFTRKISKLKTF